MNSASEVGFDDHKRRLQSMEFRGANNYQDLVETLQYYEVFSEQDLLEYKSNGDLDVEYNHSIVVEDDFVELNPDELRELAQDDLDEIDDEESLVIDFHETMCRVFEEHPEYRYLHEVFFGAIDYGLDALTITNQGKSLKKFKRMFEMLDEFIEALLLLNIETHSSQELCAYLVDVLIEESYNGEVDVLEFIQFDDEALDVDTSRALIDQAMVFADEFASYHEELLQLYELHEEDQSAGFEIIRLEQILERLESQAYTTKILQQ